MVAENQPGRFLIGSEIWFVILFEATREECVGVCQNMNAAIPLSVCRYPRNFSFGYFLLTFKLA
jgi:hypothetical protein